MNDKLNEWINRTVSGDDDSFKKPQKSKSQQGGGSKAHGSKPQGKKLFRKKGKAQGFKQGSHKHNASQHKTGGNQQGSGQKSSGHKHNPVQHKTTAAAKPAGKKSLFGRKKQARDKKGVFHKSERNARVHTNKPTGRAPSSSQNKPTNMRKVSRHQPKAPYIHPKVLRVIPIGGLNQVGQNMMVFEYEEDIVIIDMGFQFPEADMLGVDYIIPDISYLEDRQKKIKAVIITHGHLDHTGAIPYLMPKLGYPPIYGTKLTLGLVEKRVEEFGMLKQCKLNVIDPAEPMQFGKIKTSFFRVAHSIPDGIGVVLDTPEGKLVHTGDFKFDDALAASQSKKLFCGQDVNKMDHLGKENVVALFSDSTNALKPGFTKSEVDIGKTLEGIIRDTDGRIIIACFSSLIGRIQDILTYAEKYHRKVFVNGRSMLNNMEIALKLGYLNYKKDLIHPIRREKDIPDKDCLVLTTGSQGEAMSALSRMARNDHKFIKITAGDTIIFSSKPIPGNEMSIFRLINQLAILGAEVIHNQIMDVHASGHGAQEDLKRMIKLIKPKYLVPIHGEFYMRKTHAKLGVAEGVKPENCIMVQNGNVLEVRKGVMKVSKETVESKYILIDGKGEGAGETQVMFERQILSANGVLIVLLHVNKKSGRLRGTPDVISRGFMYQKETEKITHEFVKRAEQAYKNIKKKNPGAKRGEIKKYISSSVMQLAYKELDRNPLVLPLIVEH